jgi:flagellar basal body-associated protein FliL
MAEEIIGKKDKGVKKIIIIAVVVAAIVWGAYYFMFSGKSAGKVVDSSKYQAVFLTNGQVYFGKVSGEKKSYVSVTDVYYMVLKQPLQNQKKEGEEQDQAKPEYTLVKLGKEMHGPTSMSINKDQILFIENLSDDSKIVTTINSSQK